MQRCSFKLTVPSEHLNKIQHKRVLSELNSFQSRHFQDMNVPMTLSIRESTQCGLHLLADFLQVKQIMNTKQAFTMIQSRKSRRLKSRTKNKIRNQSLIQAVTHKRNSTLESERGLQRAHMIEQIIAKLHNKDGAKENAVGSPRGRIVQSKVNKLNGLLKSIKLTNNISTSQSRVFDSKYNFVPRFYTKQSEPEDDFLQDNIPRKESTFRRLKNQIMKVQHTVEELRQINHRYRQENKLLRLKSLENSCCTDYSHRVVSPYPNCCQRTVMCTQRSWQTLKPERYRGRCRQCGVDQLVWS